MNRLRHCNRVLAALLLGAMAFLTACSSPSDTPGKHPASASATKGPSAVASTPAAEPTARNVINGLPNPASLVPLTQLENAIGQKLKLRTYGNTPNTGPAERFAAYDTRISNLPSVVISVLDKQRVERKDVSETLYGFDCVDKTADGAQNLQMPTDGCAFATFDPELFTLNGIHGDNGITQSWFIFTCKSTHPHALSSSVQLSMRTSEGWLITLWLTGDNDQSALINLGRTIASSYRAQFHNK
jgi:hypothetical protein